MKGQSLILTITVQIEFSSTGRTILMTDELQRNKLRPEEVINRYFMQEDHIER